MRRWLLVEMLVLTVLVTAACSTPPPADTPAPTPILTPTPTVAPTAMPETPPTPTRRWVPYVNTTLGFAAEYPEGWGVEVHDMQDEGTGEVLGKAAEFYSPWEPDGGPLQLLDLTVQVIAGIKGAPSHIPTDQEYERGIRDWVTAREQEIVTDPSVVTVDGHRAVQVTYSGTDVFEQYSLVGHATMLVTEDRFCFIEGASATENQEEMRKIYEHFMSTFEVLPLW